MHRRDIVANPSCSSCSAAVGAHRGPWRWRGGAGISICSIPSRESMHITGARFPFLNLFHLVHANSTVEYTVAVRRIVHVPTSLKPNILIRGTFINLVIRKALQNQKHEPRRPSRPRPWPCPRWLKAGATAADHERISANFV